MCLYMYTVYCFDPALIKKQEDRVHALLQVKGYIIPLIVHALQLTSLRALFFPVQLFDVSRWFGCYLTSEEKRY